MRNLSAIQAEAEALAQSRIQFGDFQSDNDLVAVGLVGAAFGWSVATAAHNFQVVNGRIGLRPEAMLALIRQAGHSVEFETESDVATGAPVAVVAKGRRADSGDTDSVRFSLADADRAKLSGATWKQYPEAMLTWRATSFLARRLFADCVAGISYTPAELESIGPKGGGRTRAKRGGGLSRAVAKGRVLEIVGDSAVAGRIWERVAGALDLPTSASLVPSDVVAELVEAANASVAAREVAAQPIPTDSAAETPKRENGRLEASEGEIGNSAESGSEVASDTVSGVTGDSQASEAQESAEAPF